MNLSTYLKKDFFRTFMSLCKPLGGLAMLLSIHLVAVNDHEPALIMLALGLLCISCHSLAEFHNKFKLFWTLILVATLGATYRYAPIGAFVVLAISTPLLLAGAWASLEESSQDSTE
ncbi:hypothetical protein [Vibrio barjaei]|uniref:hypothetical protein n=1 Tax=Vibrio barjaei TaxID=1676683 RepID=UPI002283C5F2|nr:hypothetical protein [Vibrio barjaei]MCY9870399.1 hypothetical protein [Vibrio barjaei]